MNTHEGLSIAYIFDGEGGGRRVDWKEVEEFEPGHGFLWVHLDYSSTRVKNWLKNKSKLDKLEYLSLIAEDTRPRSVSSTNGLLVFLRGVNLNPGQQREDMVSVRIFLNKDILISSRRRKLISFADAQKEIESGAVPKTSVELLLMLNHHLSEHIQNVISDLDERADDFEEQVLTEDSNVTREAIADLRREVISIKRYLAPQRVALYGLQMAESELLRPIDRINFREATERIVRFLEELDTARDKAAISFEELNNKISDGMNKRMYIMSLTAVIFLPLTFITGLLGINVEGIPFAKSEWAFLFVAILCVSIATGLLWIFRRKKIM